MRIRIIIAIALSFQLIFAPSANAFLEDVCQSRDRRYVPEDARQHASVGHDARIRAGRAVHRLEPMPGNSFEAQNTTVCWTQQK